LLKSKKTRGADRRGRISVENGRGRYDCRRRFEVVEAANANEAIGILEALGIAETDLPEG